MQFWRHSKKPEADAILPLLLKEAAGYKLKRGLAKEALQTVRAARADMHP